MASDERGYTLAELVLVMMILSVVMALISVSFSNIVKSSSAIMKDAESDIGGLIGLELLRSDLESAGFGLPWSLPARRFPNAFNYKETLLGEAVQGYPGTKASAYNDSPPDLPKAYDAGDGGGYNGSDYLVLKGTAVGMSRVSRSWGYLNYSSNGIIVKRSQSGMELEFGNDDRVIVLKSAVNSGVPTRELVTKTPSSTDFTLRFNKDLDEGFLPKSRLDSYLVYGVALDQEDENDQKLPLSFPYNRADYYIDPEKRGESCAQKTGILYKATINQNGGRTLYPILDCVADLQVQFVVLDDDGKQGILYEFDNPDARWDAADVREHLKEVRVWVMAQQGKLERGYRFPMPDPDKAISVGDRNWTASDFTRNGWQQYHWKVYSIVVQPKNL